MEKQEILLRFVYLDGNSCISEMHYLFSVPATLTLRDVKMEIYRRHTELKEEAEYAESLELLPESRLSEKERQILEDAEENNPYFSVPPTPEVLIRHVCNLNPDWSVSQARGVFNLSDGSW